MQDIDFDEIDRAVNTAAPTAARDTDAHAVPVRRESVSVPAARRPSGRFMDVVHPSSDMRTAPSTERSAPSPAPSAQPPTAPTGADHGDWPDPLDFHGFSGDDSAAQSEAEPSSGILPESPFLSNAKVEKRPLGAFSDETPTQAAVKQQEESPLLEAPETPELLGAGDEKEDDAQDIATGNAGEQTSDVATAQNVALAEEPIGPTSITQQYKEHPSTTDQPSSSIYDTEATHLPLTHTARKKSGALVVIWILALILVGAGVGAALYLFVIPMISV